MSFCDPKLQVYQQIKIQVHFLEKNVDLGQKSIIFVPYSFSFRAQMDYFPAKISLNLNKIGQFWAEIDPILVQNQNFWLEILGYLFDRV